MQFDTLHTHRSWYKNRICRIASGRISRIGGKLSCLSCRLRSCKSCFSVLPIEMSMLFRRSPRKQRKREERKKLNTEPQRRFAIHSFSAAIAACPLGIILLNNAQCRDSTSQYNPREAFFAFSSLSSRPSRLKITYCCYSAQGEESLGKSKRFAHAVSIFTAQSPSAK